MRKAPVWVPLVLFVFASLAAPPIFAQCGVERWSVKTGTDADISQVNISASTATTIVSLRGLVQMKLMSNRDQDRVHLRDLIGVGLVTREFLAPLLKGRGDGRFGLVP